MGIKKKYYELVELRAAEKVELINKAVKAHCELCEAHNDCVDRGTFHCYEREYIRKVMGQWE